MHTQVKTPQDVFFNPQRFLVPLFQRPYVWSEEGQWRPLWEDVLRVAERVRTKGTSAPHFLGAVVLQQQPNEIGTLSVRTVIDGQQRLTTLQILLDAVHAQVTRCGFDGLAKQAQDLVENQQQYMVQPEDRFKVWPTNRDRDAFNEVMAAELPIAYGQLKNKQSRLVKAHEYFSNEISSWLDEGDDNAKANALVTTVSRLLQLVVIDLQFDEDAQEIFETLNARGTPLTAADLIKNFVFQRLDASPQQAEKAYHQYWAEFETPFWEFEASVGRVQISRSSLFLTQWLIAQTREETTAREVFSRFKVYVSESSEPVSELLPRLKRSADEYFKFTQGAARSTGPLSRLELFVYRMGTLESESVKPLLLWLTDPDMPTVSDEQLNKGLAALESWFVRRAIIRATSKRYNQVMVDLLKEVAKNNRNEVGEVIEAFLARQTFDSTYWPTDKEVLTELMTRPTYKRLGRPRLRMIIEALEDKRRGFNGTVGGKLTESSVPRGVTSIEHIMPQEWRTSWPGDEVDTHGMDRDALVHSLGNLTLVTQSLNSKVSNSAWDVKQDEFRKHTTLKLTDDILNTNSESWDAEDIHARSARLAQDIVSIWPVPESNKGLLSANARVTTTRVSVADLVRAGLLRPGQILYAREQAFRGREAYVSEDGALFVDGARNDTPTRAAKYVTKAMTKQGWWFWVTDLEKGISLSDIRRAYRHSLELEDADDDTDED